MGVEHLQSFLGRLASSLGILPSGETVSVKLRDLGVLVSPGSRSSPGPVTDPCLDLG